MTNDSDPSILTSHRALECFLWRWRENREKVAANNPYPFKLVTENGHPTYIGWIANFEQFRQKEPQIVQAFVDHKKLRLRK